MVKRYFELIEFIDVKDDDIMELLPPRRQTSDCAFCTKNYATSSPCRKRFKVATSTCSTSHCGSTS
ncbi:hypothetical protein PC116_g21780 [Phytophthora cactorum]|nr:hypothetical protein PC116_g21780 [Phytophthora cactorum]